jgi:inosose dehydratase
MIRVGNAPCSWGVLEFDLEGGPLQADQVLWEMDAAGYEGTELGDWGFLPTEPEALRALLRQHRLDLVGAFVPVALADERAHAAGVEAAVRTAHLLAAAAEAPFVVLADDNGKLPERVRCAGRIRPDQGLSAAQWDVFARGAERVAHAVREATGLRTVFHHHGAGWVETPAEVEALLVRTSPDLLGLCLDTGHWRLGGGDPLEALDRWGARVWHLHAKDRHPGVQERARREGWDYFEAVRRGIFCELGQGDVDFSAFVAATRGRDGWLIVEQDVLPGMGTPLESARRNREFLRRLGV